MMQPTAWLKPPMLGHSQVVKYDEAGRTLKSTDALGIMTDYQYNVFGNLTKKTRSNGSIVYSWEYDRVGNLIYAKMPEGEELINTYDGLNRLTLVIKGQDQRFIDYDSRGRIIRDTNSNNDITQYQYDLAGRGVQKTEALGTADEATTSHTYDENGNVLTVTNPLNKVVSYEYDALNQRSKEIDSDSTFQTITYDANGAIDTIKRQDKTKVKYIRDNLGRRKEVRDNNVLQQLFGYDSLSRMILAEDYNEGAVTHTVTMDYTDFHRVSTEVQGAYSVGRRYDKNGNKTQITYPSLRVVDKAYDENNVLSTIHNQYSLAATFTPDKNSRIVSAYFANNMDLALGYDTRGREDYRSYATPTSDPFFSADLGYDPQSNITSRSTSFNGTALSESFAYDHQDRLTTHTRGTDPDITWQYDKQGNWDATNQNGVTEIRTVNDDNEYTAVNSLAPVHDLRGNMTFDGSQTYIYDWANRLVKVKSGALTIAQYSYDALNRRVTKIIGTSVTTFVYDDSSVIEEYVDGSLSHAFVFGDHKDDPILTEYNGQTYYYVKDIQGSIRAITDSVGDLVESYEYTPYGIMRVFDSQGQDITATGSTMGNPFGYTGRRLDPESGLWYYRNRMYSAALGRFLQRDPAGYVDGLNLYAYVLNNPLRYTDPDGLMARAAYDWTSTNIIDPSSAFVSEGINYYDDKWNNDYVNTNSIIYTSENIAKDSLVASSRSLLEFSRIVTGSIAVTGERLGSGLKASFQRNELYGKPTSFKETLYVGKDLGINLFTLWATAKAETIESGLFIDEIAAEIGTNIINGVSGHDYKGIAEDLRGAIIIMNDISTEILDKANTVNIGKGQEVPFFTYARKDISSRRVLNRTEISKLFGEVTSDSVKFVKQWQNLKKN